MENMLPDDFKPKSFWEKPEGKTGLIFGIPLAGVSLWGLYKVLPFIITLLQNAITATALGVVLFLMLYVILDPRFRNLAWFMYKSFMRAVTKMFIEIDPIGILRNYISESKKNAAEMNEQTGKVSSQIRSLEEQIAQNARKGEQNLNLARVAKDKGATAQVALKARQAGRLKNSNVTLVALKQKLEVLYRVLNKMYEACLISIEDMEGEVDVREREYKAIQASFSAYRSAVKALHGDPDKRELFDQTMEYLANNYGEKVGQIEHFMRTSKNFIEGIDLQNLAFEEEALRELELWEKKSDTLLLGDTKVGLLEGSPNLIEMDEEPREFELVPIKSGQGNKYAHLLDDEGKGSK